MFTDPSTRTDKRPGTREWFDYLNSKAITFAIEETVSPDGVVEYHVGWATMNPKEHSPNAKLGRTIASGRLAAGKCCYIRKQDNIPLLAALAAVLADELVAFRCLHKVPAEAEALHKSARDYAATISMGAWALEYLLDTWWTYDGKGSRGHTMGFGKKPKEVPK